MALPFHIVEQGFSLILGRPPRKDNPPQFENYDELRRTLLNSAEFKSLERSKKPRIGWPRQQMFVSTTAKIVYNPIGKNACTFLKRQMARISGVKELDFLLPDIHFLTDNVNLGLQLADFPESDIKTFLSSPDYIRIALLRDPKERLLSAYIEKFVIRRNDPANIYHTKSIVNPVQERRGLKDFDYNMGITFREFIEEVTSGRQARLDPHWIEQSRYLRGVKWDVLFSFDSINKMVTLMEERSGISLPRQKQNETNSGQGVSMPGIHDMLPSEIVSRPIASLDSFYTKEILEMVETFFKEDYGFLQKSI